MLTAALADPGGLDTRTLGPVEVRVRTAAGALEDVLEALRQRRPLRVAFANTHLVYCALRDPDFARLLQSFYIINDGVGVNVLARLTCGEGFRENLNGTDFTPALLAALPPGTRVYLVGARPHVIAAAAEQIAARWPHLQLCGARDGYAGLSHAESEIVAAAPDLVLAAMGNPLQERWIAAAAVAAPTATFIGVGALFDFLAGAAVRAPVAVRRLRLEWAFRLAQEPDRLWRRYTLEVAYVAAALLLRRRGRTA